MSCFKLAIHSERCGLIAKRRAWLDLIRARALRADVIRNSLDRQQGKPGT